LSFIPKRTRFRACFFVYLNQERMINYILMKPILFLILLMAVSCSTGNTVTGKERTAIVADHKSYGEYDQMLHINRAIQQQEEATIYLLNGKKISPEKFRKQLSRKNTYSMEEITAPGLIRTRGYDADVVKRIISISR